MENKFPMDRPLQLISSMISDKMKAIDGDLKKHTDQLQEYKNALNTLSKGGSGNNFMTSDFSEKIYSDERNAANFVETQGSQLFSTVVVILQKQKDKEFIAQYSNIVEDAVIPGSHKYLQQEDKEGNQLWRIVAVKSKVGDLLKAAKRYNGFVLKEFSYNRA